MTRLAAIARGAAPRPFTLLVAAGLVASWLAGTALAVAVDAATGSTTFHGTVQP